MPNVLLLNSGQLYSRYTTYDWQNSNTANFHLSDRERATAERIRADAFRTVKATDTRTRNRQSSNTKKLSTYSTRTRT